MARKKAQPVEIPPFFVRDCALVMLSTGQRVYSLRELASELRTITLDSIYHHFWGRLLQPRFDEPEYANDFAAWTYHSVHDKVMAERLSMIDPTQYVEMADLRDVIIELLEIRLDEGQFPAWSETSQPFHFLKSQTVVFDTDQRIRQPQELAQVVPKLSSSSIYYHFIDARRRTQERLDDFSVWLSQWGPAYDPLVLKLASIDPFFSSLNHDRYRLGKLFVEWFEEAGHE